MAKKTIATGDKYAGVDVTYDRARKLVTLSGWYNTHVGIAPETITLTRLLFDLGITRGDCVAALSSVRRSRCARCASDEWAYFDGEEFVCVDDKACAARATRAVTCPRCGGSGEGDPASDRPLCWVCDGTGEASPEDAEAFR